jgi:hypothetical protein
MISSIFGKTKPISSLLVLLFVVFSFVSTTLLLDPSGFDMNNWPNYLMGIVLLALNLFFVNFIITRNKLTKSNSYGILFFGMYLVIFWEIHLSLKLLASSFFVLLAVRRLISLKSLRSVQRKIFDSTFWILISSLFYDWSLLFLLLVFLAIILYQPKNLKNWLVVPVVFIALALITWAILLVLDQMQFISGHYTFDTSLDFLKNNGFSQYYKLLAFWLITSIMALVSFIKAKNASTGRMLSLRFLGVFYGLALIILVLDARGGLAPVVFSLFTASIYGANYVESIKRKSFRELVLWGGVLCSLTLFIFKLLMV